MAADVWSASNLAAIGAHDAWEYLTLAEDAADDESLSALGQEGWELVTRGSRPDGAVLYFKRRLPSFREAVTIDQRRTYYASTRCQDQATEQPNQ